MSLENINNEYLKLKSQIEKTKKEVEALEQKTNDLADDKILWRAQLIEAQRKGSKADEEVARKEIEKIDGEIKKVEDEVTAKKEDMVTAQSRIEMKIISLKKDSPDMQKHINSVLKTKYSRKLAKEEKELAELEGKRDRLLELLQLISDHPSLKNNLNGILTATNEIKKLNNELESLTEIQPDGSVKFKDPTRCNEIKNTLIPQAEAKLSKNKTPLMEYINKNNLNIKEEDIDEVANNGVLDSKGNVDLNATMNKRLSVLNKQIRGKNKSIANYQIFLENSLQEYNDIKHEETQAMINVNSEDKPRWWHFIKRIKNWNENRKMKKEEQKADHSVEQADFHKSEENPFKDSLKYEIVKEMVDRIEKEEMKAAKQYRQAAEKAAKQEGKPEEKDNGR